MKEVLKGAVVPILRSFGFSGSFPHFRRKRASEHQLLTFMFNKYGGSFYLEAGRISDSELLEKQQLWSAAGKELSESKLDVGHCHWTRRARLGGEQVGSDLDHWFIFGPDTYDKVAMQVVKTIDTQVEAFFAKAP